MAEVQKISSVIFDPVRNLTIKMNVNLFSENKVTGKPQSYLNEYSYGDKGYQSISHKSFVTMGLVKEYGAPWSKDDAIIMTQRNICHIVKAFKECIKNIYEEDIFGYDADNKLIAHLDMVDKFSVKIYNIGSQRIVLKPAVVFDQNQTSYEGVGLFINKMSNLVELSIDELENIVYCLEKIDFFLYTQALLNHHITKISAPKPAEEPKEEETPKSKPASGKNFFTGETAPPAEKEFVKSDIVTKKTDAEYFGI